MNKPKIIFDPSNLVKEKVFLTKDGQKIENTKENPRAIENYLDEKYGH